MFTLKLFFGLSWGICVLSLETDVFGNFMNENSLEYEQHDDIRLIYPGTKWCGAGNIAMDFNDLGAYSSTDKCCRAHDNCDESIEGFQSGYNLTNDVFYSRLSCKCDLEFYKCLKSIDTIESKIIGNIYFNGLGTKCFKNELLINKCVKYAYFPLKKCLIYDLIDNSKKTYQWFDLPIF